MLKALALSNHSLTAGFSGSRLKSFSSSLNVSGRIVLAAALVLLNAGLLMSYLSAVNSQSLQGYEMNKLQNQLSVLQDQNQKINLKVSEATSMVGIQSDYLSANFVPAGTGTFLRVNQYTQR